ncbi:MAG TPA: phosphatase PAP2 family protein, partial [Anaerolineales bacterium]
MESILNTGIVMINWLQSLGGWLTPIMKLITNLGSEPFYLLIAPALLWCIDSRLGMRLGIFLMINGMVSAAIKVAFHEPRPYWFTGDIKVLGSPDNSFGLPSGHSQNSVVVWGALAQRAKRRWTWVIAILLMFFIGLSRVYLALHFPHDVLFGWLFGAVMLWLLLLFEKPILIWFRKFSPWTQLVMVFLFSLVLILIVL